MFVVFLSALLGIFIFSKTQAADISNTVIYFSEDSKSLQLSSPVEKIVFVHLEATFDPQLIRLKSEIAPGPFFDNNIQINSLNDVNQTGRIKITVALSPTTIERASVGNFDLAFFDWEPVSINQQIVKINLENIQIVDIEAKSLSFSAIAGEYPIFIAPTAPPTAEPTLTPTATPTSTPIVLPTSTATLPPTATPTSTPNPVGFGLIGNYYNGREFDQLVFRRIDPAIDFNWFLGSPSDAIGGNKFSIKWRGHFYAKEKGKYTFYTIADDGVRLSIDNKSIIDSWENGKSEEKLGSISLEGNTYYPISLDYYENGGRANIQLYYSNDNTQKTIIPSSLLVP